MAQPHKAPAQEEDPSFGKDNQHSTSMISKDDLYHLRKTYVSRDKNI